MRPSEATRTTRGPDPAHGSPVCTLVAPATGDAAPADTDFEEVVALTTGLAAPVPPDLIVVVVVDVVVVEAAVVVVPATVVVGAAAVVVVPATVVVGAAAVVVVATQLAALNWKGPKIGGVVAGLFVHVKVYWIVPPAAVFTPTLDHANVIGAFEVSVCGAEVTDPTVRVIVTGVTTLTGVNTTPLQLAV